jgi:hypothetical protein
VNPSKAFQDQINGYDQSNQSNKVESIVNTRVSYMQSHIEEQQEFSFKKRDDINERIGARDDNKISSTISEQEKSNDADDSDEMSMEVDALEDESKTAIAIPNLSNYFQAIDDTQDYKKIIDSNAFLDSQIESTKSSIYQLDEEISKIKKQIREHAST